jgi:diacylglycerol kinase family enzyme
MEVANGLLGTGVPQAILPGGTGNAMAHDLGISLNLREAVELIVGSPKRQAIDLAKMGDQVFMLRAYAGLSSDDAASREEKDKYGQLAYVQASLKFIREAPAAHYKATVDGEIIEGEALICFILNAGSIGGVLGIYHHDGSDAGVYHWSGKEITLEVDPVQDVWIDGESGGKTPFTVSAIPQALEIVVPA